MAQKSNTDMRTQHHLLNECIQSIVPKILKNQGRKIGEQNTKATMIEPILGALGWDILDCDEVHREYRGKSVDSPVDYALKIMRTPRLFVEAKGLGEDLSDRKWVKQVLSYATVAGVEWCVLTDGDEWRIYNSTAAVDADEKLFRRVRLTDENNDETIPTLLLLARDNIDGNQLETLWKIHFVDRQVKQVLIEMIESKEKGLARLIRSKLPRLQPKEIVESLGRMDVSFDTPPMRVPINVSTPMVQGTEQKLTKKKTTAKPAGENHTRRVTLEDLIVAGLLKPPIKLISHYKGDTLEARLFPTGEVEFQGQRYNNPSAAGSAARSTITGRKMSTNGWIFWQVQGNDGTLRTLEQIRDAYAKQ